jgi:carbon-monoxide dehydrogenase medium subunit
VGQVGFEILRPTDAAGAVGLLARLGPEARVLGGGTAVVLLYHLGLLKPRHLVSLAGIAELDYIRLVPGTGLAIGATTTHRAVETSALVRERCPILAEAFHAVANVRVRNQATVGGVVAEADYASDPPCVLAALDASVVIRGPRGPRTVPMAEFVTGLYETVLAPDEIVTGVVVPEWGPDVRGAYIKFVTRSSEDRPCVAVAAVMKRRGTVCEDLRVAVGAVAATPQRVPEIEALGRGERVGAGLAREVARRYAEAIDPIDDLRGSAWYRKRVIEVLVRRAVERVGDGA